MLCGRLERIEGLILLLAAGLTVVVVIGSIMVGAVAYERESTRVAAERASGRVIEVTLLETATVGWSTVDSPTSTRSEGVRARWVTSAGVTRTERVFPARAGVSGDRVEAFLDANGRPAPPPPTAQAVVVDAVSDGASMILIGGAGLFLVAFLGLVSVSRRRRAAISAEWADVEPRWTNRRPRDGRDRPSGPVR